MARLIWAGEICKVIVVAGDRRKLRGEEEGEISGR
jgi:hypothetical protein